MARQDRPQARRPRPRDDSTSVAGTELVVDVAAPAHGGHAVARSEGRVIFVRHALPGERVRVRVTQGRPGDSFWRADVAEVIEASPDRVVPPCPLAVPGGCGGCDLQHVAVAAQRDWKASVVTDLLLRVGRLAEADLPPVVVEALPGPGEHDNLRWRGRQRFAVAPDGRLGLRTHRGHRVVPIEDCPISSPEVMATGVTTQTWQGAAEVAVATGHDGQLASALVVVDRSAEGRGTLPPPGWARPDGVSLVVAGPSAAEEPRPPHRAGRSWVSHAVPGVEGTFRVSGGGFWQAHPGAAPTYVQAIRDAVAAQPGQTILDLYSGSGLFAAALADDVGTTGRVLSVEGDPAAVADARRNLHARPQVEIIESDVEAALLALAPDAGPDAGADAEAVEQTPLDAVVLDPPRSGAGHAVVDALCALEPRVVAYVACDPAALARDVARFAGHGYQLTGLRAFDAFPMTHHVECVATITRAPITSDAAGAQTVRQDGRSDAADGPASATSEGPA